ncbi:hypothetical protein QZH41_020095 [Actinostola sp. cb2023]|nr:hypothetical protein QZH41_020095 [Actinostola sp. cb2023]
MNCTTMSTSNPKRTIVQSQSSAHATKEKVEVHSKPSYYNQQQQQNVMNSMSGFPVVPPPLYGQPIQNGPFITSNSALPYPSGVYPVPVYMSYAPVLLPPIQNPMGYPMGVVANQLNQTFLTRDEAATCIQKYFRGWRVRKDSRLLQLRFLSHPGSAKRFIEDLISEFLDEDIVPDILIEVLSHKKSLSPYDPLYKMSSYLCSDILHDEVNVLLNQIAASVFYSQVDLIDLRRTDPLFQVCQELTDEVVKEMALMTVQSTIKSLVNSHMAFSKSFDWLDDLIIETIQPMIYNVAVTSLSAYKYETTLDEIVDEVTNDMMQPVIVEAWKEVIDSHRDTQITEIARFSEGRLLDSLVLEHLLSHLTGNNLSLYFRDYMEQTMDGFICGALLHQYMLVHDASEDTLSNRALQNYHQESYADMVCYIVLHRHNLASVLQENTSLIAIR